MTAGRVKVGLSKYQVSRLTVCESGRIRPSEHPVVGGDVQMAA